MWRANVGSTEEGTISLDADGPDVIDDPAGGSAGPRSDLGQIGERRVVKIGGVRFAGRRRRPSGEKEPLPREFRGTGTFWALAALGGLIVWALLFLIAGSPDWWTRQDLRLLLRLEDMRTDAATALFKAFNFLTTELFIRVVRWGTILALVFYRRWRHLVAGMAVFLIVDLVSTGMAAAKSSADKSSGSSSIAL